MMQTKACLMDNNLCDVTVTLVEKIKRKTVMINSNNSLIHIK